ncbi:DUF4142 domain-containing protein [Rufibacter latericius]|uniref:DUF4142 domain-containing protein n=1 Tax=Rufibacter latericius TaxID=2487040 RepID=A0A3M9MT17_9BACT|nr:DUF4142 domain-containing protein [Rufibacter latericius]RNI28651.1 DUF4142 domain-containing protein [Rufibacter latericius]
MKNYTFYLLLAACVSLVSGCGGSSSDATSVDAAGKHNEELLESTGKDEKGGWFVAEAASGGLFEVELGRLASSKATDPRVKQLGQLMMDHHTQTNTQLKQIADLKNLMVPTTLGEDHQEAYNTVMSSSGAAFDKAYVEALVKDHKEAIEQYEEMSEGGKDMELKAFAGKSLPTLRAHLEQVEQLEEELNARQ